MEISYQKYPMLFHTSFDKEDAPEEIPFSTYSVKAQNYLSKCTALQEMLGYIGAKNTLLGKNNNIHYFIEEILFHKIDEDDEFRQRLFASIFTNFPKPRHGVMLLPNGGQYVYMLLSKEETKKLKNENGRYIAVALFKENTFVGFEEGYILENGIQIAENGWYEGGMDIAGYISFVLITLSYAGNKNLPFMNAPVKEQIFELK